MVRRVKTPSGWPLVIGDGLRGLTRPHDERIVPAQGDLVPIASYQANPAPTPSIIALAIVVCEIV